MGLFYLNVYKILLLSLKWARQTASEIDFLHPVVTILSSLAGDKDADRHALCRHLRQDRIAYWSTPHGLYWCPPSSVCFHENSQTSFSQNRLSEKAAVRAVSWAGGMGGAFKQSCSQTTDHHSSGKNQLWGALPPVCLDLRKSLKSCKVHLLTDSIEVFPFLESMTCYCEIPGFCQSCILELWRDWKLVTKQLLIHVLVNTCTVFVAPLKYKCCCRTERLFCWTLTQALA